MKIRTSRILEAVMFVLLLVTSVAAVGQISAEANVKPCEGLSCNSGSDCGTSCFCNTPSTTCYLN